MKRLLRVWALMVVVGFAPLAHAGLSKAEEALGKGVKLIVDNKPAEALPFLQSAIAADPKLTWAHYNLGVALKMTKQYEQAVSAYRQAYGMANQPSLKAQCLYGIGLSYELKGAWREAADAWQAVMPAIRGLSNESKLMPIVKQKLEDAQKNAKK